MDRFLNSIDRYRLPCLLLQDDRFGGTNLQLEGICYHDGSGRLCVFRRDTKERLREAATVPWASTSTLRSLRSRIRWALDNRPMRWIGHDHRFPIVAKGGRNEYLFRCWTQALLTSLCDLFNPRSVSSSQGYGRKE